MSKWIKHLFLGSMVGALPLFLSATPARAAEETKAEVHKYVGVESCAKICHKTARQGKQLIIWEGSKHSHAYEVLGTPEAKKIAKAQGIADPQKSEKCLKCHSTAPGVAANLKEATFVDTLGVQCERCHGPGSDYKKFSIMRDKKKAEAAGLIIPDEKTCVQCHNKTSPTFKGFNYAEYFKKIAHMKPKPKE